MSFYVCWAYFVPFFLYLMSANNVDPDQMPHYMAHNVASDLGLHCLPMTLYGFPGKNGLTDM